MGGIDFGATGRILNKGGVMQFFEFWSRLSSVQKGVALGSTIIVFIAIVALSRLASTPSMSLLYSGLTPAAAGEVIGALEQDGVSYQVRNGSIYVDARRRDTLRLTLAAEGLPANGSKGYELLDGLSGFGTTSRMFDAAYWRAIEGELARTISSGPQITSARVHIANASSDPFRRGDQASAAVTIHTANGSLSSTHARALTFLVASSIVGLSPENVTIMDENGDLLGLAIGNEAGVAKNQSDELRARVLRLLEARVGPGNAVVEVAVETVTEREQIVERRIDPSSRVAISTDSEERNSENSGTAGGGVTVASNLPDGDAANGSEGAGSKDSEIREVVNYEVSETHREITRLPGAISRLSVAILVNAIESTNEAGEVVQSPRTEEELNDLKSLVSSAVGLNTSRGDSLTIRSMAFEPIPELGSMAGGAGIQNSRLDWIGLAKVSVLALVILVLGLFVLRPMLTRRQDLPEEQPQKSISGVIEPEVNNPALSSLPTEALPASEAELSNPVDRLRELIGERQDESIEILQSWLEEREERV